MRRVKETSTKQRSSKCTIDLKNCIYQCQVTGNIYENPELLKERG